MIIPLPVTDPRVCKRDFPVFRSCVREGCGSKPKRNAPASSKRSVNLKLKAARWQPAIWVVCTALAAKASSAPMEHADPTVGWVSDPSRRVNLGLNLSCLLTLGLSFWSLMHLNIPHKYEKKMNYWQRNVKWVFLGIFIHVALQLRLHNLLGRSVVCCLHDCLDVGVSVAILGPIHSSGSEVVRLHVLGTPSTACGIAYILQGFSRRRRACGFEEYTGLCI
jgi:hypothetical protein